MTDHDSGHGPAGWPVWASMLCIAVAAVYQDARRVGVDVAVWLRETLLQAL